MIPRMHRSKEPGTRVMRSYVAAVMPYRVISTRAGIMAPKRRAILSVTRVPLVKTVTRKPLRAA